VRIFDQSEYVAERIENGGDADSFANILNVCALSCAEREQAFQRRSGIGDSPINDDTTRACGRGWIGVETELEAADVETDIKRLIEVGLDAENF